MQRFFSTISFFSLALISNIGTLDISLNRDSVGNNVMLLTLSIILKLKILKGESNSCNMRNFRLYFIANFLLI